MDAAGVIAHYVMDTSTSLSASGDRPLMAESNGNTNFYLYGPSAGSGWGVIDEKTTAWNFSLPDGTNTPRQLSDSGGEITLSARYTPCPFAALRMLREGDTLETYGTGNPSTGSGQAFTFGYPSIELRASPSRANIRTPMILVSLPYISRFLPQRARRAPGLIGFLCILSELRGEI